MAITAFSQRAREELKGVQGISPRAFFKKTTAESWNLIWEAGPYYEKVAAALEQAHSYAIFVGWQIDSRLQLTTFRAETFKQMLIRLCSQRPDLHIYFLMWDHAYFYIFEREIMQSWVWENVHERVHFIFDNRHPYGAAHHEKIVVVDGEVAFLGGVDICDDRWDTPGHLFSDPRRSLRHDREEHLPYHDLSVEVRGEVAADLVEYIGERWRGLSSVPFPERPRIAMAEGRGAYRLLISRTRAAVDVKRPLLIRETEFLFREIIRSAQSQLVIENQYYWSRTINDEIIALMRRRAGTGLRIFMVVPAGFGGSSAFRMMGGMQTELLHELQRVADETGTRLMLGCPFSKYTEQSLEKPIYVHSKIVLADDRYMAIGSANFNNRGFRLDTEITLTLLGDSGESRKLIHEYARRIVGHWGASTYAAFFNRPGLISEFEFASNVHLRDYHAAWRHHFTTMEAKVARLLPVEKVLDPNRPMAYPIKRRLLVGNEHRLRRIVPLLAAGSVSLSIGLTLVLYSLIARSADYTTYTSLLLDIPLPALLVYALALGTTWLVPSATALAAVGAGIQLGGLAGAALSFCGVLVSGCAAYLFSRVFPSHSLRFYRARVPEWLSQSLGQRRFGVVLRVMLDPRISLQSKAAYQGIFSIPVRWFTVSVAVLAGIYAIMAAVAGSTELLRGNWLVFSAYFTATVSLLFGRVTSKKPQDIAPDVKAV